MACDDLHKKLQAEFEKISKGASPNGNITDEMVLKSEFNRLVEQAARECNRYYSIKWSDHGYVLSYE